jgi:hypothetical protein
MVAIYLLDLYVTFRLFHVLSEITRKTRVICTYRIVILVFKQCFYLITLAEKEENFHV